MLTTSKQERFCDEYLVDLNGQQAAIRSGYSPVSAKVQASRLLTNDNVRQLIQCKLKETEQRLQLQRDDVIRGLIKAAEQAKEQDDPQAAIDAYREIGRMLGYYERPAEVPVDVGELSQVRIQEMTEQELLKLTDGKSQLDLGCVADTWVIT